MRKILLFLLLVLFTPFYVHAADPTTEAECNSAGGTCKHGCSATEQLYEDEIGVCGGNPWNINCCKEKTEGRPGSSGSASSNFGVEAMCTCKFFMSPPVSIGKSLLFPTKACESLVGGQGCECGDSGVRCTKSFMSTKDQCADSHAEQQTLVIAVKQLPIALDYKSSGCVWSGAQTPSKTAVKAKACVPKAVAKAKLGQLDLSGVSSCCISNGDCTLDDIVTTGASFANLLTQLSAAFFFATFVYGGAMYLLSFGDKGRVDKGKKAITGAAIGMLIVLMAWTIVNYIANALKGKT